MDVQVPAKAGRGESGGARKRLTPSGKASTRRTSKTQGKADPDGVTASRPDKASEKRKEIILAAASLFARKGYSETTLGDVAQVLKIRTTGLYYYFDSRDALVEAVLRYAADQILSQYRDGLGEFANLTALGKLKWMIRHYIHAGGRRNDVGLAFWKIYDQVSPELRTSVIAEAKSYFDMWRIVVDEAAREGSIRNDLSPGLFRQLLIGCLVWIPEWYSVEGENSLDEIADAVIAIFIGNSANRATG